MRFIHKWVGLVIGLFLFISCLTGAFIIVGKLAGSYAPFFGWMVKLHRSLFLGDFGSLLLGIATLLMVLEVVTGYYLWWKLARGQMSSSRKRGEGSARGFWRSLSPTKPVLRLGLHVSGGFWSGVPLLLMALTGLTWSFGWYSSLIFRVFDPAGTGNLFHTIASLHTGRFLGIVTRIVWLLASLVGASLPITGLILSLHHRSKRGT